MPLECVLPPPGIEGRRLSRMRRVGTGFFLLGFFLTVLSQLSLFPLGLFPSGSGLYKARAARHNPPSLRIRDHAFACPTLLYEGVERNLMVALSVVVPVKDEAENAAPLAREIAHAMAGESFEIIFVDDGSCDST